MTTGATGQLGLALPVQGELSGTWGDTVNNGITQYTNIAIAGTLTLTDDGAVTLANTTGDASASNITSSLTGAGTVTAQFAIVKVTGTLTAVKVITGPSYSKTYVVDNTTATYAVTFKASGQTGVSIAAGEKATVYYNGTDYVKVASSTADGVTTFSAGTTGFTPSTATSGAVTLAGTLATTNGGTGLTSFTSGGVVYASSTSALATGSALTFDGTNGGTSGLWSVGNLASVSGGYVRVNRADNATYNEIKYATGDLFYLNQANGGAYQFNISGSEQMRLNSTGLGIGTNSPAYKLDVAGIGRLTTAVSSNATSLILNNSNSATGGVGVSIDGYSGNTSNKLAQIVFGGAGATGGNIDFLTSANGSSYVQQMRLDTSGNLGVGTTSPSFRLDVQGSASFNNDAGRVVMIGSTNTATINYGGGITFGGYYNGTTSFINDFAGIQGFKENSTAGDYAGGLRFTTRVNGGNPTERARIDSAGYLSGVWADKVTALGNSGTATTITCTSGNVFTATLTGNCTFTLSAPSTATASTATSFTLILTNDGTAGRTVAFSGGTFKYPGGSVTRTTTANATDIWFFFSPNGGTTWYVSIPMANLS